MSLWRTVGASRWWYRFPETSEHNLSLSSSCLKERNLQLRHTEVCFLKVLDRQHSDTCWSNICIELFSLLSSFMFCSIKVISCKLNTSLWSYWLNEAQLKTAGWRDGRISFSIPPKMFWIWIYFYKLQQTLSSGCDVTNLLAQCRLWFTDAGSDVIWVKATDHILFNSTKLFF